MTDGIEDIVFVSTHLGHLRGGAEVNDLRLGAAFEELGHRVTYITLQDSDREPIPLDRPSRVVSAQYWYGRSYDLPNPIGKLIRHLNEELFVHKIRDGAEEVLQGADIVLTTGRPVLVRVARTTDAPVIHAVRGRVNPLYDRYLCRADGLVFWGGCESEYDPGSAVLDQPRVTLDPAVDTDLFRPLPADEVPAIDARDRPVVGFVGRLEEVKQVDRLIEAVARLSDRRPVYLLIVGDGSRRDELERLADDRLATDSYEFTGRVPREEVPGYLNAMDVFAMASRLENHPIALKEAVACGIPCVAPDIGRVEQILPGETGIVFEGNVDGLVRALDTALDRFDRKHTPAPAGTRDGWLENAEAIIKLATSLRSPIGSVDGGT